MDTLNLPMLTTHSTLLLTLVMLDLVTMLLDTTWELLDIMVELLLDIMALLIMLLLVMELDMVHHNHLLEVDSDMATDTDMDMVTSPAITDVSSKTWICLCHDFYTCHQLLSLV